MPRVGDQVGSFALLAALPVGRRGERFLGSSIQTSELGVVEIVSPDTASDPTFDMAFRSEVAAASLLDPRTSIRVLEHQSETPGAYIATEWLPGASLDTVLGALRMRRAPMDLALAAHIAIEIARALNSAHTYAESGGQRRPILHLRLTAEDVWLSTHGQVKVGGFGAPLDRAVPSTFLAFAAPEILRGEPVDTRADIYSLGSILNLILSGEDPIDYGRSMAPMLAPAPPDLMAIIRRAMEPDPGNRWASTTAFRTALQAWAKSARFDLNAQTRALPEVLKRVVPESQLNPPVAAPKTGHWGSNDDKTTVDAVDPNLLRASLGEPAVAVAPISVGIDHGLPSLVGVDRGLPPVRQTSGFSPEAAGQTSLDPVDPALLRALRQPDAAVPWVGDAGPDPFPDPFGPNTAPNPGLDGLPAPVPFGETPFPGQAGFGVEPFAPTPAAPFAGAPFGDRFPPSPIPPDPFPGASFGATSPHDEKTPPRGTHIPPEALPDAPRPRSASIRGTPVPGAAASSSNPALGTLASAGSNPGLGAWGGDTQEGVVDSQLLKASFQPNNDIPPPPWAQPEPKREAGWEGVLGADAVKSPGGAEEKLELATEKGNGRLELAQERREEQRRAEAKPRAPSVARPPPKAKPPGESRLGVFIIIAVVVSAFFVIGLMLFGKL